MLIVMKADATRADIDRVVEVIETLGFRGHTMPGESRRRSVFTAIRVRSTRLILRISRA
jgi:hypothetical protein